VSDKLTGKVTEKVLAIDFGMRRVGFAVGNKAIGSATPVDAVNRKNSRQIVGHIKELILEYGVSSIVVGYPLHMDGNRSATTEQVEHFTRRLKKSFEPDIPVKFVDERLSSFEAEEEMKASKLSLRKQKGIIDSMSALVILKRFLRNGEVVDVKL
jgi:putative Holliday junction resolvase